MGEQPGSRLRAIGDQLFRLAARRASVGGCDLPVVSRAIEERQPEERRLEAEARQIEADKLQALVQGGLKDWLYKQSPNSFEPFNRRWFVFEDGVLSYYMDSKKLDGGKQVSLAAIHGVQIEVSDPTLVLGSRSALLNFLFVDGEANVMYRRPQEAGEPAAGDEMGEFLQDRDDSNDEEFS